jgi:hypothetical protein
VKIEWGGEGGRDEAWRRWRTSVDEGEEQKKKWIWLVGVSGKARRRKIFSIDTLPNNASINERQGKQTRTTHNISLSNLSSFLNHSSKLSSSSINCIPPLFGPAILSRYFRVLTPPPNRSWTFSLSWSYVTFVGTRMAMRSSVARSKILIFLKAADAPPVEEWEAEWDWEELREAESGVEAEIREVVLWPQDEEEEVVAVEGR